MGKRKKKKSTRPIDFKELAIKALVDFLVGLVLLMIDKIT